MNQTTSDFIRSNYEAFKELLPQAMVAHRGMFALLRDGTVAAYYQTWEDAYRTGRTFYEDGRFSVQEVTTQPVDLGFFSHAIVRG